MQGVVTPNPDYNKQELPNEKREVLEFE